jgi:hypothetical protein
MAAPVIRYTREEQRSVIRFLWSEVQEATETFVRIGAHYFGNTRRGTNMGRSSEEGRRADILRLCVEVNEHTIVY